MGYKMRLTVRSEKEPQEAADVFNPVSGINQQAEFSQLFFMTVWMS